MTEPARIIKVTGLEELEAITGEVELIRPGDGAHLLVPYRSLTSVELGEIRAAIAWPVPPKTMVPVKGGKPRLMENPDDPDYRKAAAEASEEMGFRVVTRCLIGGGLTIPGATDEERAAVARKRLGAWAVAVLSDLFQPMHSITPGDVEDAAKN